MHQNRSNGKIPPTINPFLFRSNNKDGRKNNNNPSAPAYSHENYNKNNDDKFGLEKMFIGDNTKSGAALTTVTSNPRLLRCPLWRVSFCESYSISIKKDIIKNCRHS
ncbi:MAG: hypothetical protein WBP64_19320 [Nitrososphaeraceae archaeon]